MNKKALFIGGLFVQSLCLTGQQLAFPGAEGFGKYAVGGRGGEVYHVTNLNDSGSGSLRDAVSVPGRTVVFDVSGVIHLKSRLVFKNNLTIAGQTAPGNGIVVYGNGVSFSSASNIIVRYMKFRMGNNGTSGADAAGIANGTDMIFDHVSVSWGLDENFSVNWDNKGTEPSNITIQNSIIGQGILTHSCGGLIQTKGGVSLLRNLYIDNKTRNPKVKGLNQFVNNVVYNWGTDGYILSDSDGDSWATIENCYFIQGPNSGRPFSRPNPHFQLYQSGNMLDLDKDGTLNGRSASESDYANSDGTVNVTFVEGYDHFVNPAKRHPEITNKMSAEEAYHWIVAHAGASLPERDAVDNYMIEELTSLGKKGEIISSVTSLGIQDNVGVYFRGKQLSDTDRDGMPDSWEDAHGLDKNNPADGNVVREDGYTNLEYYINSITEGQPYLKYPTSIQVVSVQPDQLTFKWNNNQAADRIDVEYSMDNIDFTLHSSLTADQSQTTLTDLTPKTTYYIRLRIVKGEETSEYSDKLTVTTKSAAGVPDASTPIYPADKETVKEYESLTLKWNNTTGTTSGLLYYTVSCGTDPDNLTELVKNQKTIRTFPIQVEPETTYYWRVDTQNGLGLTPGDLWSFTTGKEPVLEKVFYVTFDNNLDNSQEEEHRGIAQNFATAYDSGVYGAALSFPGTPTNQHVKFTSTESAEIGQEAFSVELWFKAPALASSHDIYLMHKGSHTASSATGATGRWFGLQVKNNTMYFGIDDDVTKSVVSVAGASYFNDAWHHVVCVRDVDAKKLLLYIDGELKVSGDDKTAGSIASAEDLVIGNCNVNFNTPYKGLLDEFSIFNHVLEPTVIGSRYKAGLNATGADEPIDVELKVYPVNFKDHVIVSSLPAGEYEISLLSMTGQTLFKTRITAAENMRIDLPAVADGIYFLQIEGTAMKRTHKLIK